MFAQRLAQVSESATMKVAAEAERLRRAGHSVVDFSAGEPDFPTPEHVKAAAKAAIDANFTRYTAAAGIPELREAICGRYKRDYGVDVSSPGPERPLRKPEHFRRALGRHVKLKTEAQKLRGEVTRADDETVTVAADGGEVDIPYGAIVRGNLIEEKEGR